jgi:putative transposase
MAFVLRRCRELYNAALQKRKEAWQKCGVSVSEATQSSQLPVVKEARPEYRGIHSQVLQEALTRLDRAFQQFFARVKAGQMPGYPRFQGAGTPAFRARGAIPLYLQAVRQRCYPE